MLNRSASLAMSTNILKALPRNLISKDTHLVFPISSLLTYVQAEVFEIGSARILRKQTEKQVYNVLNSTVGLIHLPGNDVYKIVQATCLIKVFVLNQP